MATTQIKTDLIEDGAVTSAKLDTNIAIDGNLTVDTNTLYVDSTNNRVGIGTDSPAYNLEIRGSSDQSLFLAKTGDSYLRAAAASGGSEIFTGGNLTLGAGNTERMRIYNGGDISFRDTSNNEAFYWDASTAMLGIGTDSPTRELEVQGGGNVYIRVVASTDNDSSAIELQNTQETWTIRNDDTNDDAFEIDSSTTGNIITIEKTGNVGIGTTNPAAKLHIKTPLSSASSEEIALRVESSPAGGTADRQIELVVKNNGTSSSTYGLLRLGDHFTNAGTPSRVLIAATGNSYLNGGNVGIGETNPTRLLHLSQNGGGAIINIKRTNAASSGSALGALQFLNSDGNTMASVVAGADSSNTTSYLSFSTTASASTQNPFTGATERIRITSGGDVFFRDTSNNAAFYWDASAARLGIGTGSSPSEKLEVKDGSIRTTTLNSFSNLISGRASVPNVSGYNIGGLLFQAYRTGTTYATGAAIYSYSDGGAWTSTSVPSYLSFHTAAVGTTNATERMTINSSGKVSVGAPIAGQLGVRGTTNDSTAFSFEAANSSGNSLFAVRNDGLAFFPVGNVGIGTASPVTIIHAADPNGAILRLERKDNNVLNGDLLGGIETYRDDDDGAYIQTFIKSYATETYGRQGYMTFGTNNNNNGDAEERMRITSGGDISFRDTSNNEAFYWDASTARLGIGAGSSPAAKLHVVGGIVATGDVTAYYSSDERLKENKKIIENATDKIEKISGYEFDWIAKEGVHINEGHDVGVMAQEVEKILPEIVTTRDNGYKAVKYEKLVPLLIESIKELSAQIKELQNKPCNCKK